MITFMSQRKALSNLIFIISIGIALALFNQLNAFAAEQILLVSVDNLNVRENPSIKAKAIIKLPVCSPVNILKVNSAKDVIDGKSGKWVYVDTYYPSKMNQKETIKGWIFDYYLGTKDKFSPVSVWKVKKFEYCDGDYCVYINFSSNGFFTYSYDTTDLFSDCKDCKCLLKSEKQVGKKCNGKGQVYKFNKLIWLKKEGESAKESKIVYLANDSKLCVHPSECNNIEEN